MFLKVATSCDLSERSITSERCQGHGRPVQTNPVPKPPNQNQFRFRSYKSYSSINILIGISSRLTLDIQTRLYYNIHNNQIHYQISCKITMRHQYGTTRSHAMIQTRISHIICKIHMIQTRNTHEIHMITQSLHIHIMHNQCEIHVYIMHEITYT